MRGTLARPLAARVLTIAKMTAPGTRLVPVHVALPRPGATDLGRLPGGHTRSALLDAGVDWPRHGLDPRWLGMETSDCAAALDPIIYAGHGAEELERFFSGAGVRGEMALIIATIGDVNDETPRSVLHRNDASMTNPLLGIKGGSAVKGGD